MVYLVLLIGILAVSGASILIKLCDAPAMVIASYRLTLSSLFFLAITGLKKHNPIAAFNRSGIRLALLSGLFLCLHFATWITSLKFTSVANSVMLVSTAPIFVALGSFLILKEKISGGVIAGIVIAISGMITLSLIESSAAENARLGNALALLGAVGGAGYFLIGRKLRARIDTLTYVSVVYSVTAIFLVIITFALNLNFVGYEPKIYLLFLLIALAPQVIGHTSFNWALKYVSATMVALVTLGEPIGASILAFFVLGEKITAFQAIGGSLILSGVGLAIWGESPRRATTEAATS
jgi:drug/metabolite transporter (DMT)-like permease